MSTATIERDEYTVVCGCGCGACADVKVSPVETAAGLLYIYIEGGDAPKLAGLETLQDVANDLEGGELRVENEGGLATIDVDSVDADGLRAWLVAQGVVLPQAEA